jgi:hypothetical protein
VSLEDFTASLFDGSLNYALGCGVERRGDRSDPVPMSSGVGGHVLLRANVTFHDGL